MALHVTSHVGTVGNPFPGIFLVPLVKIERHATFDVVIAPCSCVILAAFINIQEEFFEVVQFLENIG